MSIVYVLMSVLIYQNTVVEKSGVYKAILKLYHTIYYLTLINLRSTERQDSKFVAEMNITRILLNEMFYIRNNIWFYVDNKRGMLKRKLVGLAYHTYTRSRGYLNQPARYNRVSDRPRTNGILYRLLEFTESRAAVDLYILERLNVVSTRE